MTNARVYVLPLANLFQVSSVYVSYMNVIKCLDAVLAAMISPCSFQKHFSYVISQTFALDCLLFFFAVLEFLLSHNLLCCLISVLRYYQKLAFLYSDNIKYTLQLIRIFRYALKSWYEVIFYLSNMIENNLDIW